jgi:ATP-binding cassette subfamily B protein
VTGGSVKIDAMTSGRDAVLPAQADGASCSRTPSFSPAASSKTFATGGSTPRTRRRAAAKTVHADDIHKKYGQRYYTKTNDGARASRRDRSQLISFARTLLSDPRILILDEATSCVDTNTERLVQEGIAALLKGRTSFIVAHRLSTIRTCDRIFYVDDGVIAEAGSHDELMRRRGLYSTSSTPRS